MTFKTQGHPLYWAFLLHRISGIGLALFLPVHLWLLSSALTDPDQFDRAIAFTDHALVKIAEAGLVFLLCAHLCGGLRILALEALSWTAQQKTALALGCGISAALALAFLLGALS